MASRRESRLDAAAIRVAWRHNASNFISRLADAGTASAAEARRRPRLVAGLAVGVLIVAGLAIMQPAQQISETIAVAPEQPGTVEVVVPAVIDQAVIDQAVLGDVAAADPVESETVADPLLQPVEWPEPPELDWHYVRVASGETLERIFRRLGLSPRLLHEVVNLNDHTRGLARIRPGDEFAFDIDAEHGFRALRADLNDETWLFVENTPDGLTTRTQLRSLEHRVVEAEGEIRSSLFNAATSVGLADELTLRMTIIFGWDIDFALDIRAGDRFAVIYEKIYRDGEFLRDGAILAARFVNQGRSFEAIRFDAGDGPDYYAPDGRPMRKAFLRAPLNFTRVTSNFNPRRFHPITRRVRPHNGTDYGAPTGTPVWASGDGRVIESAYNNVNGHYIFIRHANHIVTRYLHLSRRQVNRGDRVRQGQTIGRVGATGLATGPHLHYEFLLNGAHRDPRRVDLPEADPLPDELLPEFRNHASPLLARLDDIVSERVLLARAGNNCGDDTKSAC